MIQYFRDVWYALTATTIEYTDVYNDIPVDILRNGDVQ